MGPSCLLFPRESCLSTLSRRLHFVLVSLKHLFDCTVMNCFNVEILNVDLKQIFNIFTTLFTSIKINMLYKRESNEDVVNENGCHTLLTMSFCTGLNVVIKFHLLLLKF